MWKKWQEVAQYTKCWQYTCQGVSLDPQKPNKCLVDMAAHL